MGGRALSDCGERGDSRLEGECGSRRDNVLIESEREG
jgi:hypothetical protein